MPSSHLTSSVIPFSSCLQSLPALGSSPMSQLFAWGGQSTYSLFKKNFFYWNRVDLQCCVSFGYTAKWFSHVLVTQLCLTLCDSMDCSPPGSSVYGILQARILEWVAISFSKESSWPSNRTCVSCIAGRFFTNWATREAPLWCICIANHHDIHFKYLIILFVNCTSIKLKFKTKRNVSITCCDYKLFHFSSTILC